MATKPRHKKTLTQLWVYDNAKRLGLKDSDLAQATGVKTGTARSWFSRGKPNADAIPALERLFGRPAPDEREPAAPEGTAGLAEALTALTDELRAMREERQSTEARLRALEAAVALLGQPADEGPRGQVPPRVEAGSV